jgi:hypothetical protein
MPYNKDLDTRITALVAPWGTIKKNMFGGTCHLLNGNMMCGVHKDFLILRLGQPDAEQALVGPNVRPMDITGKPMKGWVMIERAGYEGEALNDWLRKAKGFAEKLPSK